MSSVSLSNRSALSIAIFLISISIISYYPGPTGFISSFYYILFSFGKAITGPFFLTNSYFGFISYFKSISFKIKKLVSFTFFFKSFGLRKFICSGLFFYHIK